MNAASHHTTRRHIRQSSASRHGVCFSSTLSGGTYRCAAQCASSQRPRACGSEGLLDCVCGRRRACGFLQSHVAPLLGLLRKLDAGDQQRWYGVMAWYAVRTTRSIEHGAEPAQAAVSCILSGDASCRAADAPPPRPTTHDPQAAANTNLRTYASPASSRRLSAERLSSSSSWNCSYSLSTYSCRGDAWYQTTGHTR